MQPSYPKWVAMLGLFSWLLRFINLFINADFSISLSLVDRVFGLPSSIEFNNWLNLFCSPFIIFLRINTVNFLPIILHVFSIGQAFIFIFSEGLIIRAVVFLALLVAEATSLVVVVSIITIQGDS